MEREACYHIHVLVYLTYVASSDANIAKNWLKSNIFSFVSPDHVRYLVVGISCILQKYILFTIPRTGNSTRHYKYRVLIKRVNCHLFMPPFFCLKLPRLRHLINNLSQSLYRCSSSWTKLAHHLWWTPTHYLAT